MKCETLGLVTPATVCDHVERHNGDAESFFNGDLQSLCKSCHDGLKQREELRGFSTQTGVDGWPIDPTHPFNKG